MSEEISKASELPKAYDPSTIEERWAGYWVHERIFQVASPDTSDSSSDSTQQPASKFTMLLPPPNVTGFLHMGHMFEHAESDILVRWHRMSGDTALWVPGTDHAGIATQMLVERQLAKEGVTTRQQLGREAFTEHVWAWKRQYGGAITGQMRRLGASVDWSREYFTMDDRLSVAVREAFVRLYEQGLIYRGAYIVNWDPVLQTAVSDLEVVHEERTGKLFYIRYPLADGTGSIVIATTRPETMPGDVAVAVNPNDARYTGLIGKQLTLPLSGYGGNPPRQIPILADEWASPEFGTGAVKVTPAHDANDFAIGQRHHLPSPVILDASAHIDLPGSPYHGLARETARERIVADLQEQGFLVETKDHNNAIALSQRSGAVIEPRLSLQWFLAVNKSPMQGGESIAAKAIAAVQSPSNPVGPIAITPAMYAKTYDEWMRNIHDWCISRQLWWGHRIPAWHCDNQHVTVAREAPAACTTCGSASLTQDPDVLDTWFSSGLLPITVFGWPEGQGSGIRDQGSAERAMDAGKLNPALAFYPTDLLVTGFDILFFWVARMIMLGTHFMLDVPMPDGSQRTLADAVPFKAVYIHALIRDANREKMSKTKGNVIDPIDIIERFGTDAVRFTLASMASPGTDIAFSEARTEGYRAFANKIWNAARFLFMNLDRARAARITISPQTSQSFHVAEGGLPAIAHLESQWVLARLAQTCTATDKALTAYRFDEAANAVYQFFWGDLCDWYLEIVKLRLNFGPADDLPAATEALTTLVTVFEAALRLLSPFMPFITEEIWQALWPQLGGSVPAKSIALTRYPRSADFPTIAGEAAISTVSLMQDLIVAIRGLRKEMGVPEKESTLIQIFAEERISGLVHANTDLLQRMARVTAVEFASEPITGNNSRSNASFQVTVVYERTIDVPAERERLGKEIARLEKGLQAAERQLSNEAFMAKAPVHIVEGLRKQAAETRMQFEKTQAALTALPGTPS